MASFTSAKVIRIKQLPIGVPQINLPSTLKPNELRIEAQWISVDPYLRGRIPAWGINQPMQSYQIAKILESKDPNYSENTYIYGHFNWQTQSIIHSNQVMETIDTCDIDNKLSLSQFIGAYGMPGATAYYGMIEVGKLQFCENVLISGAAGAVGSYVGQIAKLYDCFVVGICGSNEKINWIVNDLNYDYGINYKKYNANSDKLKQKLIELFPNGIDIYFDNVGGFITESVWDVLADRARVLVCGQISVYNKGGNLGGFKENGNFKPLQCNDFLYKTIYRQISVKGFLVTNFKDRRKFKKTMKEWIISGKIKTKETVVNGFDNIPKAFVGLFSGVNTGKMVIKCKL